MLDLWNRHANKRDLLPVICDHPHREGRLPAEMDGKSVYINFLKGGRRERKNPEWDLILESKYLVEGSIINGNNATESNPASPSSHHLPESIISNRGQPCSRARLAFRQAVISVCGLLDTRRSQGLGCRLSPQWFPITVAVGGGGKEEKENVKEHCSIVVSNSFSIQGGL